ncbi:hypothetical protein MKX03_015794 [Papaver bracteatum]|nr:hypothetical protein MKX03_015794 [Papaver bracteatum]
MEEQGMLSMESNITTLNGEVGEEGCSDSNSNTSSNSPSGSSNNHQRKDISATSSAKLKGVVSQPNGHWGAQIYSNHQRIWIGTFKSKYEAGKAYDAANCLTINEVFTMMKDGSYFTKLHEFVNSRSLKLDKEPGLSLISESAKDGAEQTPSDYFLEVSKEEKDAGVIDDTQLSFFGRGWNRFVKDRKLKATMWIHFISASVLKSIKRST